MFHQRKTVMLDNQEISFLSLFYLAVNFLFLGGEIATAIELIKRLEPLRDGWKISETIARNEHVYYHLIAKSINYLSIPLDFHLKPIYLIGDSHCIPLSWHSIAYRSEQRILVPNVVPGITIWSLREGNQSIFPHLFWKIIDKLPENSDVILLLGSIDSTNSKIFSIFLN